MAFFDPIHANNQLKARGRKLLPRQKGTQLTPKIGALATKLPRQCLASGTIIGRTTGPAPSSKKGHGKKGHGKKNRWCGPKG